MLYCTDPVQCLLCLSVFTGDKGLIKAHVMDEDSKPLLGSVRAGEYYTDSLDPKQRRYWFSAGFSLTSQYQYFG